MATDSTPHGKPGIKVPGIVEEILKPGAANSPEMAQIRVGGDPGMEIRIDNSLSNARGEVFSLKQGVPVDVIVESDLANPAGEK